MLPVPRVRDIVQPVTWLAVVIVAVFLAAACGADTATQESGTDDTPKNRTGADTMMVEKDEENSSKERTDGKEDIERLWSADEIVFINLDVPTKPNQDYLMAEIEGGKLMVDGEGCLRIDRRYLPVWAYEYSLRDRKGEVMILNEKGRAVARVGSRVSMGGGEVKSKELRRELDVSGRCRGILWPVTPPVNIYPERTVAED